MDLGIKGRRALVCASSRGLGRACAHSLAQAGVDVVINGRDESALAATADALKVHGVQVTPVLADVSTAEGQAALMAACPSVDILVNNNGGPPHRDFRELDRDAMLAGVTMNMVTPIEMIQHYLDGMVQQEFGRIVNITSMSVRMPILGLDLSSGARAGLTAFLAGIARSVADKNVTINHLAPGAFDTDRLNGGFKFASDKTGESVESIAAARAQTIPAKRFGDPVEFGDACAFLCSARSGYITGQTLLIDGGVYNSSF